MLNEGYLKVSNIHSIYYSTYGNKNGMPLLFIHGGPGGCSNFDSNFLNIDTNKFYMISIFRDNVDIVNSLDINFLTRFRNISADTVALVFSYPRYPSEMQKIIEALYEKKIDIIGLTNSQMSPIVPFCKYVLITPQKYLVPTEPIASVVTMIHALTVGIYKADPIGAMEKLKQYEQAVASNAVFELKNYNFAQQL